MAELAQHIRIRLSDGRVIADTTEKRRTVARVVLAQAREDNLLAFGLADDHLHLESAATRRACSQLARRIELSLHYRLGLDVAFIPAHLEPIRDSRHLYSAFTYILTQLRHHNLDIDPLFEATNLPDLLGLRLIGRYTVDNVRRFLPRITRIQLLDALRVSKLEPGSGPLEWVVQAALAASALPTLHGSGIEVVKARRAVIEIVGRQLSTSELAAILQVDRRSVPRLRARPVDVDLVKAIRLQLDLMAAREPIEVGDDPIKHKGSGL